MSWGMSYLRVGARLIGLCSITTLFYLLWLGARALTVRSGRRRLRARCFVVRNWARCVARLISMRVITTGRPPQAPYFLVANHLSYVDILVLATELDSGVFIARDDLANWPAVGRLARTIGTIFVDRSSFLDIPRVIRLIEAALDEGSGVILFPEGTSTRGDSVLAFNPSLLEPAARMNIPVSYVAISYQTPPGETPAYLSICWWGDMTFIPHLLGVLKLKRSEAYLTFGDQPISDPNRKILARKLHAAVVERFTPVIDAEPECISKEI